MRNNFVLNSLFFKILVLPIEGNKNRQWTTWILTKTFEKECHKTNGHCDREFINYKREWSNFHFPGKCHTVNFEFTPTQLIQNLQNDKRQGHVLIFFKFV